MVAVRICVDFPAGTEGEPVLGYDDGADGPDVGEDGPGEDEEPDFEPAELPVCEVPVEELETSSDDGDSNWEVVPCDAGGLGPGEVGVGEGVGEEVDEGAVEEEEVGGGLASEIEGVSEASPLGCFMGIRLSSHSMKHLLCVYQVVKQDKRDGPPVCPF